MEEQYKFDQFLTFAQIEKLWKEREPWLFSEIVLKVKQKRSIKSKKAREREEARFELTKQKQSFR